MRQILSTLSLNKANKFQFGSKITYNKKLGKPLCLHRKVSPNNAVYLYLLYHYWTSEEVEDSSGALSIKSMNWSSLGVMII